jgi:aryl-alcohol dehydrogenase-like predicted oxidoreductase
MDYRQLGASGLRISAFMLGTMTFGGRDNFAAVGSTDVAAATRQIDLCIDRGINLFDTANVYSDGLSEEILGKAVGDRRDRVLIATKARMPMGDGPNDAGLSRRHLIAECEASLRRLGTDHIDLYQVHEWDGQTPLDETLETLDTLVRAGKVRYVGCSNYAAWQLMKARDRPAVSSLIIGARTEEQLADNLAAADLTLASGEQARLEAVSRPPLLYPYWHQAKTAADRLGPADLSLLGPHLA